MINEETFHKQVATELPGINHLTRLYEDEYDLSMINRSEGEIDYLTSANIRAALATSPHFVSHSGHGSTGGCCCLDSSVAGGLSNPMGFIMWADSCFTNGFDTNDAMSEALINNPNGGAVAYVGNTRYGWIDVGDDYQRAFFHALVNTRHLGLLNDTRMNVSGTVYNWVYERWSRFLINLLGDPELQVYRAALTAKVNITVV